MASELNYSCTRCKKNTPRDELTVKKSVFLEMGELARTIRSRVVDWLCPECVVKDLDWRRPPNQIPGNSTLVELRGQ